MFDILFTTAVIVFIFGSLYWVHGKDMFVIIGDKSYGLFSNAFKSYRSEVINRKKLYERYVDDFCIKNTSQTHDRLNKYGTVVSSPEKNCIKNRVQNLLNTRPDLVVKFFQEKTFTYKDYKQMIDEYDTTYPIQKPSAHLIELKQKEDDILFMQNDTSNEKTIRLDNDIADQTNNKSVLITEKQERLVRERILIYNSDNNKMHLGDRLFGYLLKAKIYSAKTPKERLYFWHKLLGDDIRPSDTHLFYAPHHMRSEKIYDHLEEIQIFLNEIGLHNVASIVGKNLEQLKRNHK